MSLLVFIGQDERLFAQLQGIAGAADMEVVGLSSAEISNFEETPAIIVVELELKGAIDAIAGWKMRWPHCMVAGSIMLPVQELWHAAVAAGCDLVSNRGALPKQIRLKVESYVAGQEITKKAKRLRVLLNERQGDGQIGRLADAPDGPIAVFRIGEKLCAFRDVCPHAGFSLADGELQGKVITCPQHGSQFNICTGSRLRGPADFPIRIYRIVTEGNEVFVEI